MLRFSPSRSLPWRIRRQTTAGTPEDGVELPASSRELTLGSTSSARDECNECQVKHRWRREELEESWTLGPEGRTRLFDLLRRPLLLYLGSSFREARGTILTTSADAPVDHRLRLSWPYGHRTLDSILVVTTETCRYPSRPYCSQDARSMIPYVPCSLLLNRDILFSAAMYASASVQLRLSGRMWIGIEKSW